MYQQNRRRHPRFRAKSVATHVRGGDKSPTAMQVDNISLGGVFVRTGNSLPVGTPVILEMVRAGLKRAIELTGRVVNVITPQQAASSGRLPGMGVHFDPLPKDVEGRLAELIRSMSGPALPNRATTPAARAAARSQFVASAQAAAMPAPVADPLPVLTPDDLSMDAAAEPTSAPSATALRPPTIGAATPPTVNVTRASNPGAGTPPVLLPRLTPTVAHPALAAAAPVAAAALVPPTSAVGQPAPQVTVQVRSLLLEIGDLKAALHEKSREVQKLQTELSRLKAELQKRR